MIKCTEEFLSNAKKQGIEELLYVETPNCLSIMQPTLVKYIPGESIEIKFPILELYLNPFNAMQGGFIAAALDNAYGLLNYFVKMSKAISLDLNTSYLRPIYKGDELTVKVYLKYGGNTIINMYAEAFNNNNELIVTSDSKMMVIKEK